MKLFRIFSVFAVALLGMVCMSPIANAAQEAGYSIHVDFKTREVVQCVSAPIGTLRNMKYFGDINVSAIFAISNQTSLGFTFTKRWAVADNASIDVGPSIRTVNGPGDRVHFRAGAAVTLNYRF